MPSASEFFRTNGHTQLSREQAVHFYDVGAWQLLSPAERCGFQIHQEYSAMPFGLVRKEFDSVLGENLADVAFNNPAFLARCLEHAGYRAPDVEEVISRIPEEKRGPLAEIVQSQGMKP